MKTKRSKIARAPLCAPAFFLALMAPPALAAGNGTLGATSSGSIALRVTVPPSLAIKAVAGVRVDEFDGARIDGNGRVCVRANLTGAYSIRVTSRTGRFTLSPDLAPGNAFCRDGTALSIQALGGAPDPSAAFLKAGTVVMTVVPQ